MEALQRLIVEPNMTAEEQISRAIAILDGNAEPVDWTDLSQPELLRKLSEHVAAFEMLNDSIHG